MVEVISRAYIHRSLDRLLRVLVLVLARSAQGRAAMSQGALFGGDHVYLPKQPRDTQVLAAERILPRTGTDRRKVYDAIAGSPDGLTDEEITERLAMNPSTERPRRGELEKPPDGSRPLIRDSGRRRRTRSGCPAIVWEVVR